MIIFIYLVMAFLATIFGAITGMGGGIIMKPVMDSMGHYNAQTIGILSSVTVFAMAVMSFTKKTVQDKKAAKLLLTGHDIAQGEIAGNNNESLYRAGLISLSVGSLLGGFVGQVLFDITKQAINNDALLKIIQNAILCGMIVVIFLYMLLSDRIKTFKCTHYLVYGVVALLLGIISSFLGIGGGPINVAIFMFMFSHKIKLATFASIVTILFAQISKIAMIAISGGFYEFDGLSVLPFMVTAALIGSFLGSLIKDKISPKAIKICFNFMQVAIAGICVYNIITLTLA